MVSASVQQSKILSNEGNEAGFCLNDAVKNSNVQMYVPANQSSDFHYNVSEN